MAITPCDVHINSVQKEITPYTSPLFPVACFEDDMSCVTVPFHWHDEFEFIYVHDNMIHLHLQTEQISLKKGSAVFINSGCLHSVKTVSNEISVLRSLFFLPRFIGGSPESCFWQKLVLPFYDKNCPPYIVLNGQEDWHKEIIASMTNAWEAIVNENRDYENYSRYMISRGIGILQEHLPSFSVRNARDTDTILRMKELLHYIEEHYSEDINIQTLTHIGACSESVLLRSFRKTVDTSPMQYIMNYRIEKAALMLQTTTEKSYDIAAKCGFNDFSYFTKVFHRKTGKTPIEYRSDSGNKPA